MINRKPTLEINQKVIRLGAVILLLAASYSATGLQMAQAQFDVNGVITDPQGSGGELPARQDPVARDAQRVSLDSQEVGDVGRGWAD